MNTKYINVLILNITIDNGKMLNYTTSFKCWSDFNII